MSTAILLTALFLYLVLPSFIPIKSPLPLIGRQSSEAKDEIYKSSEHFKVSGIEAQIADIGWNDSNTLLISTQIRIYTFKAISRELTSIYNSKSLNEKHIIQSNISNDIRFCTWENYIKQSPKDIGTKVIMYSYHNMNIESEMEISLAETVKIERCGSDAILLSEAYPFMQEQRYTLSLPEKKIISGWAQDIYKGHDVEATWKKPFPINIEMISVYKVSPDGISMAYIDQLGSLWIYKANE